ncbi:MAG TPA: hypothetical protein VMB48_16225 [Steroidobacteraceae bacterium]|nr:hypothetical protein [Steroidobacteraceae bacterium]
MRKLGAILPVLLLAAAPAFAADVDGNWSGSIDTPNGPVMVSYTFKAAGAALTGSTKGPDGSTVAIKDGKIEGSKISFSLDLNFGGNATTFKYTGMVSPGQIALSTDFMGQSMSFTLKKAG